MLQWNKDLVYAFCLFVGFFWYISLSVSTAHSSPFLVPVTHLHPVIKLLDLCLAGTVAAAGGWGRAMKVCLGARLLHGRLPAVWHCQGRCYLTSASSFWSPWWDRVAVEDPHFGTYDDVSHLGLYFTAHDFLGLCLWLCFSNPRVNKMARWGTARCTIQLMVCPQWHGNHHLVRLKTGPLLVLSTVGLKTWTGPGKSFHPSSSLWQFYRWFIVPSISAE